MMNYDFKSALWSNIVLTLELPGIVGIFVGPGFGEKKMESSIGIGKITVTSKERILMMRQPLSV